MVMFTRTQSLLSDDAPNCSGVQARIEKLLRGRVNPTLSEESHHWKSLENFTSKELPQEGGLMFEEHSYSVEMRVTGRYC